MSLDFANELYNPSAVYVATLNNDNSYGTPQLVQKLETLSWNYESANDEINAYGMFTDSLALVKKATGSLNEAHLNWDALVILTGEQQTSSGSTPNQVATLDTLAGGEGLPYFGIITVFRGKNSSGAWFGFPKAQLTTKPGFEMDQDAFRRGSADFNAYAPSTLIRKIDRGKKYETLPANPTGASDFDTYFTGMFDS